jgi:glycosyltransferase involved in cell wall biosynthesis
MTGFYYWLSAFRREELDIFEAFNLPLHRPKGAHTILTIHDVRRLRSDTPMAKRMVYAAVLRHAVNRADHIVTVSAQMKRELMSVSSARHITSVYNGIDLEEFAPDTPYEHEEIVRKYDLPPRFLLSVGHLEYRKNYIRLIKAVANMKVRDNAIPLVIVGNDSGLRARIVEYAAQSGLGGSVRILSGVPDADLRIMYRRAELFVFPSLYEGFGIPMLEAMASRCPLVLSDIPVFREIAGDAAAYFDPLDVDSITSTIIACLADRRGREMRVSSGEQRVQDFDFREIARQIGSVYDQILRHRNTNGRRT